MVREKWTNLNGAWEFSITPLEQEQPEEFESRILVPFPVESTLSGVTKPVTPDQAVWYRREFQVESPEDERTLLHFGAVDWDCTVWVNGARVGSHQGGFDPFSFDVTHALKSGGPQQVVVRVTDPTNRGTQPWGKQSLEPGGIVYTAVTGIWQTVWLETVPTTHITSLEMTPDVDSNELIIRVHAVGPDADRAIARVAAKAESGVPLRVTGKVGKTLRLRVPDAHLWTPDDPYLYDLSVDLAVGPVDSRAVVDRVESYFGMRKVEVGPGEDGHERILLNGQEVFSFGPLDQGWWPDGLYTAPSDEALRWDIEVTKRYGFNTCRKHVKVEPARWYYWCDKLGLLVWQDMPNGGERGIGQNEEDMVRSEESEATFRKELKAMIDTLANHPSIIVWVPFNEGWGQFKTNEILGWVKEYDPTRLVDGPSGWTDRGFGDLIDRHEYPGPLMHDARPERASVLGEFGGLGLTKPGHIWFEAGNWGYENLGSEEELAHSYRTLIDNLWLLKREGLAAAIYTQTTDVETEVNGLITYDRKVMKIDPEIAAEWNRRLYTPAPKLSMVVTDSRDPSTPGHTWRYTTDKPNDGWADKNFDDTEWKTGRAGFGAPNTPGATVRTEWGTADIWMRRTVRFEEVEGLENLCLSVHHDEDAEIYLDGVCLAELTGYSTAYKIVSIPDVASELLAKGDHVLAIHCHQTRGGQYVDVGLAELESIPSRPEQAAKVAPIRGAVIRNR